MRELVSAAGLPSPRARRSSSISTTPTRTTSGTPSSAWRARSHGRCSLLPEDEREASRQAIVDNMERLRNEDGSYTAPAASWGVLVR